MIANRRISALLALATWTAALLTCATLLLLVGFILVRGIPHLSFSLFSLRYNSQNLSLMPALLTTLFMALLALVIALPLGVFAAIYLEEYAPRRNKVVALVGLATETLAGIPSIVYGLFGLLCFVTALGWGYSVLAGACTLSIMILPLIIRTSQEALRAVPSALREGSFGLGAGKVRTVFQVVLPSAMPGILAGVVLSVGRIVGESAALLYTAGTVAQIPSSPMQSARTLAIHMYILSREGLHMDQGYATAAVLLVVVFALNTAARIIAKRLGAHHALH